MKLMFADMILLSVLLLATFCPREAEAQQAECSLEMLPNCSSLSTNNETNEDLCPFGYSVRCNRSMLQSNDSVSACEECVDNSNSTEDLPCILNNTEPTNTTSVICVPCHVSCSTCNATGPGGCLICADNYTFQLTSNGSSKCMKNQELEKTSKPKIGIIVGASIAGAVVAIAAVVVVVCLCCRSHRRKSIFENHDVSEPSDIAMETPLPVPKQELKEEKKMTKDSRGIGDHTYTNVVATSPRPLSIERGHDKVTRYVRDPTVKKQAVEPLNRSDSEENELNKLPPAPPLPGSNSNTVTPPEDEYEDVDQPTSTTPKLKPRLQPLDSYEIMDLPMNCAPKSNQQTRSKTTAGSKLKKNPPRRKTEPTSAHEMPYPEASKSYPDNLPRFPFEEAKVKKRLPPLVRKEIPKDDIVEEDDPDEDYENVRPKERLVKADQSVQLCGIANHALVCNPEEDPQEIYCNQDAIAESEAQLRYQTLATGEHMAVNRANKTDKIHHDDDHSVYGNEILDENPYQNVPPPL